MSDANQQLLNRIALWRREIRRAGAFQDLTSLPDLLDSLEADVRLHARQASYELVRESALLAINAAYGTDPRHELLANAIGDRVTVDKPLPWNLVSHFGPRPAQQDEGPVLDPDTYDLDVRQLNVEDT